MGQTLSATVAPVGATVTYKWQRGDAAGGSFADISGAKEASYVLTTEDEGKFIKVVATGTGKFNGTVTSTATTAVVPADAA